MKIRRAQKEDLEEILTLFKETVTSINTKDYTGEQIEVWRSGSEDKERWLRKIEDQYFLVAEEGSEITGFSSITSEGYLDTMFVHKHHQRKGVAKFLLEALMEYAGENHLKEVVTDASISARPFFEKYDFRLIKKQLVNKKGIEIPNFRMSRNL